MERYLLTGHFYVSLKISLFFSFVQSPLHVPQQGPHGQGYSVTRATGLFIHSFMYVCWRPQKGSLLRMRKNIRSPSTEPHTDGWPTYNTVRPGSPRGLLRHCCLYPSATQPSAQYLPPWLG